MKGAWFLSALSITALGALVFTSPAWAQPDKEDLVIHNGSQVSLEYTLRDEEGSVIESNEGKDPFTYTHGQGQIIPGLENGLEGMRVGAQKSIHIKPEDAYGPINASAFDEVPLERIPSELRKVGAMLQAQTPDGQSFPARVHEIKEKTVVLDFNHPLAGKTLTFDVKILTIEPSQTP